MVRRLAGKVSQPHEVQDQQVEQHFTRADKIKTGKVQWLLPHRIVANAIAVLEGDSEGGKSTFLAHLASAITTGLPWLDRPKSTPQSVLWLAGEESVENVVRPRLERMGADLSRVYFPARDETGTTTTIDLKFALKKFELAVQEASARLVIVDPMISYMPFDTNLRDESEVRRVLDPLNQSCISKGYTTLLTRHWKKDRSGPRLLWGLGGIAVSAVARSVLSVEKCDVESEKRILRVVKCFDSQDYKVTSYVLDFSQTIPVMGEIKRVSEKEIDDLQSITDSGERDVRGEARDLLRQVLAEGWVKATAILKEAEESGISPRTLRKAKGDLRVSHRRIGNANPPYSEWGPPAAGWGVPPACHVAKLPSCSVGATKTRKKGGKNRNVATEQHGKGSVPPPHEPDPGFVAEVVPMIRKQLKEERETKEGKL